jgi:hypothetical protein
MGEAAARKVTEIEETRVRLEQDLHELEERLPAPLRSVKSLVGMVLGAAVTGLVLRSVVSRRSSNRSRPEVVVRIVRDDG